MKKAKTTRKKVIQKKASPASPARSARSARSAKTVKGAKAVRRVSSKKSVLWGALIGLLLGLVLVAIFLLTKDMQGAGNKGLMIFRIFFFILTLPSALPLFFIPVNNVNIDPYLTASAMLIVNWVLVGGLVGYLRRNRDKIIPFAIVLSLLVVTGGFYVVIKTLGTIRSLTS